MNGTFEFKLSNGNTCTIKANYECIMENENFNADGNKIVGNPKPKTQNCDMVVYINEKEIENCWNPNFWNLIDTKEGIKKIWGLNIGFANPEDAKRYEEWIAGIIDAGTSNEVKEYKKAEKENDIKERVERARKTIEMAENQKDIPTRAEAKRRMKQYNDIVNEGGEGYVPHIVCDEEYKKAKEVVDKYDN